MRAGKIGGLGLVGGVVLMWIGCARAPSGMVGSHRPACAKDTDCPSRFCDRGNCLSLSAEPGDGYGVECEPRPFPDRAKAGKYSHAECVGYVCVDGRCRACESNADCEDHFGSGKCVDIVGAHTQTGGVCWPMAALRPTSEPEPENIPGSIEFCAHDPAEAPDEKRLARGSACRRDCDCLSALCDRGLCADRADLGAWNYGKGPCVPGPPHALHRGALPFLSVGRGVPGGLERVQVPSSLWLAGQAVWEAQRGGAWPGAKPDGAPAYAALGSSPQGEIGRTTRRSSEGITFQTFPLHVRAIGRRVGGVCQPRRARGGKARGGGAASQAATEKESGPLDASNAQGPLAATPY
jgi:hypothetical protein